MKRIIWKTLLLLVFATATVALRAQDARFKLGIGANYVSNNYDEVYLLDYGAFSLNTAYTLLQQSNFSVNWEQNFLLRQNENQQRRNTAFQASLPLTFRLQLRKTGIYAGMGPTYLSQKHEAYTIRQRVSGMQATALAGVAIRGRQFAEVIFPEYHIRATLHRSLDSRGNLTPQLSALLMFGSAQRVPRR